jgi:hypothetical protein
MYYADLFVNDDESSQQQTEKIAGIVTKLHQSTICMYHRETIIHLRVL